MNIASAEQMRELDRKAIEEAGVPSLTLMEFAAAAVAKEALELAWNNRGGPPMECGRKQLFLPQAQGEVIGVDGQRAIFRTGGSTEPLRAAVFCGVGNNGGDGVAAARLLLQKGVEVRAFLVGDRSKMTQDCREMARRFEEAGGALADFIPGDTTQSAWLLSCDVQVDALFGIGLARRIEGDYAAAVAQMNASHIPTVAVDISSGIETDTGRILGIAVKADCTVTFTCPKAGHFVGEGGIYTGRLTVAGIGIPDELCQELKIQAWTVSPGDVVLPHRRRDAHKGDYGRVCILGGCVGYTGAPVLAAKAAVRSGAGLVTVLVPDSIWPVAAAKLECAMPRPLPAGEGGALSLQSCQEALKQLEAADTALIGPGLSRDEAAAETVRFLLAHMKKVLVLDADGINALEGHIHVLDGRKELLTVLTPHDGEFSRLGGDLSSGDRLKAARDFALQHGCVLVLKGYRTITAFPDGRAYINTTGNPGMAKGGSGDILAGMIAALIAQGLPVQQAVPAAVCLHGQAGDLAAEERGEYGMSPADMLEKIPLTTKCF